MVARIAIFLLATIILSDLYIYVRFFRKPHKHSWPMHVLMWGSSAVIMIFTCVLSLQRNFAPLNLTWLNVYLFLLVVCTFSKSIYVLCSIVGLLLRRFVVRTSCKLEHYAGLILGTLSICVYIYGITAGVSRIKVNRMDLTYKNLPASFDGYTIIHVSDLHLGTFKGWRSRILKAEMDSIRRISHNLICFTGDLQNMHPSEIEIMKPFLSPMQGTVAVLGNHDYAGYFKTDPDKEYTIRQRVITIQRQMGWHPLLNDNIIIRSKDKKDSIVILGTENDGKPPYPSKADYTRTIRGINPKSFAIMLQHDPSAWRRNILRRTNAQLTLCGHTHGGQMQILGLRPTQFTQKEDHGLYEEDQRHLYVTAGLGGMVPFRLNMPNEITVITLHKQ